MHIIKAVEITRFRNQKKPIKLAFDKHANFIIGRNGTGKTTLINLLNAALSADIPTIRATQFEKLVIRLQRKGSRALAHVALERTKNDNGAETIAYEIKRTSRAQPETFVVMRRDPQRIKIGTRSAISYLDAAPDFIRTIRPLKKTLESLFSTTWLSLLRRDQSTESDDEDEWPDDDDEHRTDVDRRLSQVFANVSGYFYRLDHQVAERLREFQKQWFLSFINSGRRADQTALHKIDVAKEREALSTIFENFELERASFSADLDEQFSRFQTVRDELSIEPVKDLKKIAVLIDTLRLHFLVDEWQKLQDQQKAILRPKFDFAKICSEMLYRKTLTVGENNRITLQNDAGHSLAVDGLSSGEKQLLIFLSESLLQEKAPHIFLADEPELSLHVEWQEELVTNLLKINPNAQVLFATHSPDIVGPFQNNLFEMEKIAE